MTKCKSFQIIFNEADGQRYSATFDIAIGLECRGKFVDIKGKVHYMNNYSRTLHSESTSLNIIHNAAPKVLPNAGFGLAAPTPSPTQTCMMPDGSKYPCRPGFTDCEDGCVCNGTGSDYFCEPCSCACREWAPCSS